MGMKKRSSHTDRMAKASEQSAIHFAGLFGKDKERHGVEPLRPAYRACSVRRAVTAYGTVQRSTERRILAWEASALGLDAGAVAAR
jgi:hypothetical protein